METSLDFTYLLQNQQQIVDGINQLWSNFKKDGQSRKTPDYIKRKVETLDQYWAEFQRNHEHLIKSENQNYDYFTANQYEKSRSFYKEIKESMLESPVFAMKPATPWLNPVSSRPSSPAVPAGSGEDKTSFESSRLARQNNPQESAGSTMDSQPNKLNEMLRRQTTNFKALLRTLTNINLAEVKEKWQFDDILKNLEARWSTIDKLHWDIDSELNGEEDEYYEQTFTAYEKRYSDIKTEINSKLWSVAHREKSTPMLEIPVFHGNYQQWTSFKDLFTEAIHNNPCLSSAQKMQFLKSKIKGEPERLIQHLQISSENYVTCWDIINHRYNNRKLIFTTHMNTLMSLPAMQQGTSSHIKRLHDVTVECMNGIKNLGVNIETWDPILIHLLSSKLDPDTHNDYMASLTQPRELPILNEFLKFLESKFTALEASRRKQENVTQRYNNPSTSSPPNTNASRFKQYYSSNKATTNKHQMRNQIRCPVCSQDHGIYFCAQFREMNPVVQKKTVTRLNLCINCLYSHNGKPCMSNKRCRECNNYHNTILHDALSNQNNSVSSKPAGNSGAIHVAQQSIYNNKQTVSMNDVLLATAQVKVRASNGVQHSFRALIDQGSQVSLISERAAQLLKIQRHNHKGVITGIGTNDTTCKGKMNISCISLKGSYEFEVEALIMKSLTRNLPNTTLPRPSWTFLEEIELADPQYYLSNPIDILLGAEVYANIILSGVRKQDSSQLLAQETKLGWILCGRVQSLHCNVVLNNIEEIQQFWQIEDIHQDSIHSTEEEDCIKFYNSTTTRLRDGRYQVRLPLKPNTKTALGQSKHKAIAQFLHLEKKLSRHKTMAILYKAFMDEYLSLGHMKLARDNLKPECYYLPHHCVMREESTTTKLRVVFNGSEKTSSGTSLNDIMYKGPNLQKDILILLLKWRQHRIAFVADIEKMFRQLWVHPDDQNLQKIIWRDGLHKPLEEFQLTTVTYGTKAAPFLAMMTLKQLARDERLQYPEAAQVVEQCFYMDDLLHGSDSVTSAEKLQRDLVQLLQSGGFNLRKWKSNHPTLTNQDADKGECADKTYNFRQPESMKTLGLNWNSTDDVFTFKLKFEIAENTTVCSKRQLLSEIARLFDPLGWLTPISTQMKLLFQSVWKRNLQWDDKIPEDINKEWVKIKQNIAAINNLNIPRWLGTESSSDIELHGFCDASQKAYACVIYCKTNKQGQTLITLVAGKSRLVPHNKDISLPKLELCGALLLATLMEKVRESLSNHRVKVYGWVDSTAVLGWLQGQTQRWKVFVANRVQQITPVIPATCWRYVKSAENPADCASRGLTAKQLEEHALWWKGPAWLPTITFKEQESSKIIYTTNEEAKTKLILGEVYSATNTNNLVVELLDKCSSYAKVIHVLAWIRRFISRKQDRKTEPYLTLTEIKLANKIIIKRVQENEFQTEINELRKGNQVPSKSKILSLNPFLDEDGIMRVGGRLKHAHINPEMKHPIILSQNSRLTELIIMQAHKNTYHGGARITLSFVRQKYWLLSGIKTTKKFIRQCITCKKHNPDKNYQIMGDLPESRINPSRPFMHTGVDYTGHVYVKSNKGRGIKTTKAYVAVFVCMVTKAVHLELVADLTTSSLLAAIRRMSARRGKPEHLYSDNGRNFLGASKLLQLEFEEIQNVINKDFLGEIAEMEITWHFNAPAWPSAGGLWEAAVKSFKYHLKRVIGEQRLTYEEFSTLLAQIEGCLNSRPLCPLTEDPEDLNYLTPSHFLASGPTLTLMETEKDQRTRWYITQKILQDLWKRWRSEYLMQLAARSKWRNPQRNLQVDDVVLIHDDNLPPGKWAMGRVTELHQGKDGYVRVVTLKTKSGYLKRPIIKISTLLANADKHPQSSTQSCDVKLRQTNDVMSVTTDRKRQVSASGHMKFSLNSIVTTLFLLLSIVSTSQCDVNVTQIRKGQGLYFDKISDMMIIKNEWKIVAYYSLEPYWEGIKALEKYTQTLQDTCNTIRQQGLCDVIILQLRHGFAELEYYNQMLLSKHISNTQVRRRRGLINGVGYLANSLFGVLDENFAAKYRKDIALVRDNEKYIASLWKNQTSVIEAEFNLLKRAESTMQLQHKMINKHINTLDKSLNQIKDEVQGNRILISFNIGATVASNMLHNLRSIQNTLLDTITDIYHGRFDSHLLTPDQLIKELGIIASQLPKDVSLPIENLHTELSKIFKLLQVKARLAEDVLIFEIRLPLISRDGYEILKLISVPEKKGNQMISIIPISDYIAINMKKDVYTPLTENDIRSCLVLSETLFCHVRKPEYYIREDKSLCKMESAECTTITKNCKNKWEELNSINTYLYFCCNRCSVRTICEDQVTAHQLTDTGIIHAQYSCIIKTDSFTVLPHKLHTSEVNLKPEIYLPNIPPINDVINISIPTSPTLKESPEMQQELFQLGESIKKLKQADVISNSISYHDIHHYTMIYVVFGILGIIGVVISIRRLRCRWRVPQPVPAAPPAHADSSARAAAAARCLQSIEIPSVHPRAERITSPQMEMIQDY